VNPKARTSKFKKNAVGWRKAPRAHHSGRRTQVVGTSLRSFAPPYVAMSEVSPCALDLSGWLKSSTAFVSLKI